MRRSSPVVRAVVIAGAMIALLALYWSTVSYHYGGDGLLFAGSVEGVRAGNYSPTTLRVFFHAHHVLYGPFGLLVHLPWDPATPAVTTMAMGNGALAMVTCVAFFLLCRRIGATRPGAFLASATLALSFAFWLFAVHAETYMLAHFGAITFLWLVVREPQREDRRGQVRSAVGPARVWALAVGGHIVNVLLVIPLVLWEWRRPPFRLAGIVVGGTLASLAVTLAAMHWTGAPWTVSGMIDWIRPQGDYVEASAGGVGATLSALALAIGPGPLDTLWTAPWIGLALVGLTAIALRGREASIEGTWRLMLAGWFATYLVFFSLWDAGNVEFSLWLAVPLFLVLALLEAGVRPAAVNAVRVAWAMVLVFMAVTTFVREIGPHRDPATNAYLQITRELGVTMEAEDRLMISGAGPSARYKFYLPYFLGRTSYGLIDRYRVLGEDGLRAELDALRASILRGERRIFGLPELFGDEGAGEIQSAGMPPDMTDRLRAEFHPHGTLALADGATVELSIWSP